MALASFCISTVLPVRGGATINPRVPLPMGQTRSSTRVDNSSAGGFQNEPLVREQRREVVEMGLVLGLVRIFPIHGFDLEQGEEAFLVLGRPDLAGDQVAGLQIETADLRRRDVDVFRTRQIIEALRTQEAEAFGQHLEHAFGEQHPGAFGVLLEDMEDDLVLAHRAEVLDAQVLAPSGSARSWTSPGAWRCSPPAPADVPGRFGRGRRRPRLALTSRSALTSSALLPSTSSASLLVGRLFDFLRFHRLGRRLQFRFRGRHSHRRRGGFGLGLWFRG